MARKTIPLINMKHPHSPLKQGSSPADPDIDPSIRCSQCEAICCRLTVYVMSDDPTPEYLVDQDENGMDVMRRLDDGWCTALDRSTMRCSIYSLRPQVCREFDMGGPDCREVRAHERLIPISVR